MIEVYKLERKRSTMNSSSH